MKEQLYTIPVNEAFAHDCECPLCTMAKSLEDDAVAFTMGDSYMEDDVRMTTNRVGFCKRHIKKLYDYENRLGLALVLKTHMDELIKTTEKLQPASLPKSSGLFKKKDTSTPLGDYLHKVSSSCFVCDKVNQTFARYRATIFYLYERDDAFRSTFESSKGFCQEHYLMLYEEAPSYLSGKTLEDFLHSINVLYLENLKRVRDDLDWFIDKFDYRFKEEPWKNSKDALPRSIQKVNSVTDIT